MKRTFRVIIPLFLLMTAIACSGEPSSGENKTAPAVASQTAPGAPGGPVAAKMFRTITSREAQDLIASRPDLMLVDLREPGELREGYIAGSELISMSALSKGTRSLPANRPLLLICAVGGRSYGVGRYYSAKGYPEIYNLKGGISAWKKAGLPLKYQ